VKIGDVDGVEAFADGNGGRVVLMLHGWPDTRSPGGNVTGLSALSPELTSKWLELLKQAVPTVSRDPSPEVKQR
jgi:hypothetical protein